MEIGRSFDYEAPACKGDPTYQGHSALNKKASASTAILANAELENTSNTSLHYAYTAFNMQEKEYAPFLKRF